MQTIRYAAIYGVLIGVVTGGIICALLFATNGDFGSVWFGYLVMLVAMSFVFVGVKRYRDVELGGVIRFWPALGLGVAIAFVGMIAHATMWELYEALTGYQFLDKYIASELIKLKASGISATALAEKVAEMDAMRVMYNNPFKRFAMVMSEPVPPAVLVALLSAALLRNPKFLPAR
jgi:hypothetical protein